MAAVATIIEKKKIAVEKVNMSVKGLNVSGTAGSSTTGEKKPVSGVGEMAKRVVMSGSSAAPVKPQKIKLRAS